jgi:hypothetical protein
MAIYTALLVAADPEQGVEPTQEARGKIERLRQELDDVLVDSDLLRSGLNESE